MAFNPNASQLDEQQIIQQVYDPVGNALNVNATVITSIEDVAIKDPVSGHIMAVNADGSINTDVIISAASDSVASWTKDGLGNPITSIGGALNVSTTGSSSVTGTVTNNEAALTAFQTSQYTIGTSSVQITPSPLSARKSISLRAVCTSSNAIYVGPTSGVTTSTGWIMYNGETLIMDLDSSHTIYAISNAASQTIFAMEIS